MHARFLSLLLVVGCGPATSMSATDGDGSTSSASSSTTGTSSTDAVTSTTSTAATATGGATGEPTSTGGATGGSTSTGDDTGEVSVTVATSDTTTTGAGTTTGESSTGEASGVVYTADFYVGQINRLTVYRADFDADHCAVIKFTETGSDPEVPVTLPPFWRVDWTQIWNGATNCLGDQPDLGWEQTDSVMGMADFDLWQSCLVDIDLVATFLQEEPWVPMQVHFLATEVPVEGPCG